MYGRVPVTGNSTKKVTDWNKLTLALYKVNSTSTALVLGNKWTQQLLCYAVERIVYWVMGAYCLSIQRLSLKVASTLLA